MNSETKLDLTRISDVDLLQSIVDITLRNKDLTQTDRDDLDRAQGNDRPFFSW